MPTQILDVVDTAVKIGLGALISGVTTYFVATINHRNESTKEIIRRRRELLESVTTDTEIFFNAVMEYWAYLIEFTRHKELAQKIPHGLEEKVEEAGARIFKDFSKYTNAEGKLLLLGFEGSETRARDLGDYVKTIRRTPWREKSKLTSEEVELFRINLLEKRKALYRELKKAYNI